MKMKRKCSNVPSRSVFAHTLPFHEVPEMPLSDERTYTATEAGSVIHLRKTLDFTTSQLLFYNITQLDFTSSQLLFYNITQLRST